jgi:hypothetical protein
MLERLAAVLALLALAVGPQVIIRPDPPPVLNTLAPTSGAVGASFDLTGKNFGNKQENSIVTVRGVPAIATFWNPTHITAIVPTLPTTGSGPVVVTVGMQPSNGLTYNVTFVPAVLTSLSVNSGPIGTSVTLTGTNFGATVGTSTIRFNGILATASSWSNTSITTAVPVGASSGPVTVTVGGVTTNGITFTVTATPAPILTSLSVPSGPVGTTVILTGSNFGATQGTSLVTFFGTAATASSWSATSITVTVPAGASSGQVQVIVGGFASNGIVFTVTPPPPVLTSLNFNTGPVGTAVTVSGTNFGATQGASTVAFNGLLATALSWSATSIATTVPVGATTGPVTVTVGGVQSNGLTFTVTTAGGGSVAAVDCQWQSVVNAMGIAFNASPKILTVTVPAGNCSWSNQLSVGETGWPVTIQGAGANQTFIDATPYGNLNGGGSVSPVIQVQQGARITGFNITCGMIQVIGSGFRIDHNAQTCSLAWNLWGTAIFPSNTNKQAFGVNPLTSQLKGLVDNNSFNNQRIIVYRAALGAGSAPPPAAPSLPEEQGSTLYSDALGLGTDNAVYVEDNVFTASDPAAINMMDCQHAGEYVLRYNTITNVYPEAHTARAYARACRKWEIYENIVNGTTSHVFLIRGGTGVVFNNTYTGTFGNVGNTAGVIDNVRSVFSDGVNSFGLCDGTQPWDGNQNAQGPGWPCLDQIGRGMDNTGPFNASPPPYTPQPQTSDPAYFWNNTVNGLPLTIFVNDAASAMILHQGRDYFLSASTAKPGYTPYQYPHPLQGPPTLASLSVPSGLVGATVTLTGSAWGSKQNSSIVRFNGTTAVVSAWSKTSITTTVPAGATTGNVTVTVNGTASNGLPFSVTPPPAPVLSSLSTTTGPVGTQVTLLGANFGTTQGTSSVAFNGTTASPSAWSSTSITTIVPVGATTGQVRVTVGGQLSNGIQFTVTGAVLTFYVSPTGNDTVNCTINGAQNINTPKRTINSAAACLVPNSQVLVRAGTYNESFEDAIPSGTSWAAKTRVASYPGEIVWLHPTFGQHVVEMQFTEQYIELDGINIDARGTSLGSPVRIETDTTAGSHPHHIRIQNAEIISGSDGVPNQGTDGGPIGIIVTAMKSGAIGFNEFINLNMHGGGDPGDFAYSFYINDSDNLIQGCNLWDTSGFAIQLYNGYAGSDAAWQPNRNIIRNNIIHDITRTPSTTIIGIMVATYGGADNQVYNNVIYNLLGGNNGGGIDVYSGTNTLVYNNTIYNSTAGGVTVGTTSSTGTIVRNNIAYQSGGNGNYSDAGAGTSQDHNIFTQNPLFVNAAGGDFHLQLGSPAINTGTPVAVPCVANPLLNCDLSGVTRPQGSAFDIGAYER